MENLAQRFVEANGRRETMSLDAFSAEELSSAISVLAHVPQGADYFRALVTLGTKDAAEVAIQLVAEVEDPGVMTETVRQLPSATIEDTLARSLHRTFLEQSAAAERYHGTRSQALLGAMYLSQDRPALLRQLQAHLLDIDLKDDGEYLRHVAKVQGLVLAHVDDSDLYRQLELLLDIPDAEDEASFALGLLDIAAALEDSVRETALESFRRAHSRMRRSLEATEVRHDAALYIACLDMLLDFQNGVRGEIIRDRIDTIRISAFEYSAYLVPSNSRTSRRGWLGSSLLEGIFWAELGNRLARLDLSLLKSAWLDAARIIEEELVRVFDASRSILKRSADGGIEAIVRPRITAAMQKERHRLSLLDEWLQERTQDTERNAVAEMRARIASSMEASLSRNPTEAAAAKAVVAAPSDSDLARELSAIQIAANSITTGFFERNDPVFVEVFEGIHRSLLGSPDYKGEAQGMFLAIIFHTLSFLQSRENVTKSSVPGVDYLFNLDKERPPLEADLQKDYFGFLQATPLRPIATSELRGRAHGRVDVHFAQSGYETVSELKKIDRDLPLERLVVEFGNQAGAYQRTNIQLCVLMVLDLFDREGGSDHMRNLVGVVKHRPPSGTAEYDVVVFRIQGRKRSPSDL